MVLAVLVAALAPVAANAAPEAEAAYTLERSAVFSLKAADGHDYRVMAAWPEGPAPATGWPVLYVLDGEDNFAIVAQTMRRLARAGARSGVEPRLVVAIESGSLARRVFDYTPATPGWKIPAGAPAAGLATGGADAFLDFLAGRVAPEIARRWSADPARQAIIGHSFGGLLALHAYFSRPNLFDTAIAISPSLWFGGDLIARERAANPHPVGRLLIAAGSAERGPDGPAVAAGARFVAELKGATPPARATFLELAGQPHGATMLAGLPASLAFLSEKDRK